MSVSSESFVDEGINFDYIVTIASQGLPCVNILLRIYKPNEQ